MPGWLNHVVILDLCRTNWKGFEDSHWKHETATEITSRNDGRLRRQDFIIKTNGI